MSRPELRASQVVTTYGPGAMVDLPEDAVIVAGLDQWRFNRNQPLPVVDEPRLKRKVEIALAREGLTLRSPPAAVEDRGFTPDIAAYRFPKWVISQHQTTQKGFRARRLITHDDLEKGRFRDDDGRYHSVVPVRFVRACRKGHVDDIRLVRLRPWAWK